MVTKNILSRIKSDLETENINIEIMRHIVFVSLYFSEKVFMELKLNQEFKKQIDNADDDKMLQMLRTTKEEITKEYDLFNFDLNEKSQKIILKLIQICNGQNEELEMVNNFISSMYSFYMNNTNTLNAQEYAKNINNKLMVEWLVDLMNPQVENESIFDGNMKIDSFLEVIIDKYIKKNKVISLQKSKLYGLQTNETIRDFNLLSLNIKTNRNFKNNIIKSNILLEDINAPVQNFDLIFFDFPSSTRNIIYASMCNKIKKLKLRGTKFEPLLLQLVMMSLNKKGRALLIVPDILLFGDSIQAVETRKYLVENYLVKKIIKINDDLNTVKGSRNSILYFENSGSTKSIEISQILLKNNEILEENIMNLKIEQISKNNNSLYYKNYEDNKTNFEMPNKDLKFDLVKNLLLISNNYKQIEKDELILAISKYYKSQKSINVINYDELEKLNDVEYYLTAKNKNEKFFIYYIESILKSKYEKFIKGKMNKYDIEKIENLEIPLLPPNTQSAVCNYMLYNKKITESNAEKINYFEKMKKSIMNLIIPDSYEEIENICELHEDVNEELRKAEKVIGIYKNGLNSGQVYFLNDKEKSNNSFYLSLKDENLLIKYVYYVLDHNQLKLKELSNLTAQTNLAKSSLFAFKIPVIGIDKQKEIIKHCDDFESQILNLNLNNENLNSKDVMAIMSKLQNL